MRRVLKGAFPGLEEYTYFRTGDHGFEKCLEMPGFAVFLSFKDRDQRIELLIALQQCGVALPGIFINRIAFAVKFAESEAARGKSHMMKTLAPSLGEEAMAKAIRSLGGNPNVVRDPEPHGHANSTIS